MVTFVAVTRSGDGRRRTLDSGGLTPLNREHVQRTVTVGQQHDVGRTPRPVPVIAVGRDDVTVAVTFGPYRRRRVHALGGRHLRDSRLLLRLPMTTAAGLQAVAGPAAVPAVAVGPAAVLQTVAAGPPPGGARRTAAAAAVVVAAMAAVVAGVMTGWRRRVPVRPCTFKIQLITI